MAGLPELAWRSSLDLATKTPSPVHIAPAAFVDHIRRYNPECWAAITKYGVTPDTLRMLRKCCAECKRLATKPERVLNALAESKMTSDRKFETRNESRSSHRIPR